jgi:hypothetical protein
MISRLLVMRSDSRVVSLACSGLIKIGYWLFFPCLLSTIDLSPLTPAPVVAWDHSKVQKKGKVQKNREMAARCKSTKTGIQQLINDTSIQKN